MKNNFLILGNSVSGTSLLQSLLNHHLKVECKYEWFKNTSKKDVEGCLDLWIEAANSHDKIWGNKIPLEQFFNAEWTNEDITNLINPFYIIFIQRRFSMYAKQNHNNSAYQGWWERANEEIYWSMREAEPSKIIAVSFEDLCIRPYVELLRICKFLDVKYNKDMMKGTDNVKSRIKKQGCFDLTRV